MSDVIRIVIVDDHPVVREGWAAMLNRREDMDVVGEGGNGVEGLALYQDLTPDVMLVDLRMPEMSGVELIEAVIKVDADARLIVLTTYDGDEDIYRALQAGAKAYLLKDTSRAELLETIRMVHSGRKHIPSHIAEKLSNRMMTEALTTREIEVLELVAKGYNNRRIGETLFIAEGTVKAHINRILGKLNANDRTQAVTIALEKGILHL